MFGILIVREIPYTDVVSGLSPCHLGRYSLLATSGILSSEDGENFNDNGHELRFH